MLRYKGKNIAITLRDKENMDYTVDTTVRHEFTYGNYDVIRISVPKGYFEIIGNMKCFHTPPLQYLKVVDIKLDGVDFRDKDFGWLNIEDLSLKLNVDRKYTVPTIDILLKRHPNNETTSILYVAGDQISRLALHSIMINL